MNAFLSIWLFIIGVSVGSFINVLIDRLPQNESVIFGRSYCDWCRKNIRWFDLIPLLSFIFLGGKCRYCRKEISWQYPLVEFITGILFVLVYSLVIQIIKADVFFPTFVFYLMVTSGLLVIFFTDWKYKIIPDQMVILLSIISLLYLYFYQIDKFIGNLISAMVMFLIFFTLLIFTKGKGMGFGDVKFAAVMGLILGYPKVVVSFYLAFLTGAILSLILIISSKKTMKSTIPFGPFLTASTIISIFYGEYLWRLFKSILGI